MPKTDAIEAGAREYFRMLTEAANSRTIIDPHDLASNILRAAVGALTDDVALQVLCDSANPVTSDGVVVAQRFRVALLAAMIGEADDE